MRESPCTWSHVSLQVPTKRESLEQQKREIAQFDPILHQKIHSHPPDNVCFLVDYGFLIT